MLATSLSYTKGTSDKIARILKTQHIVAIFTQTKTIHLSNPIAHIQLASQGVYSIQCKQCDEVYMG